MFYKHQKFVLDEKSKRIFDENGKELRLTGNAYCLLVFLCKNKSANLTEIGTFLDWAKDYNENHIRQYRYKINTIIGEDVIEYQNGIYSLAGNVKELKEMERNTDLLHSDDVESKENMKKSKNVEFTIIPAIISIVLLLLTFLDWPYGYYTFLRFIITGVAVYYAFYLYVIDKWQDFWFWGLIIAGILFNPIVPVYLGDKAIWGIIDIIVPIFFVSLMIKFKRK